MSDGPPVTQAALHTPESMTEKRHNLVDFARHYFDTNL
jgi:hypothetical protein